MIQTDMEFDYNKTPSIPSLTATTSLSLSPHLQTPITTTTKIMKTPVSHRMKKPKKRNEFVEEKKCSKDSRNQIFSPSKKHLDSMG